MRKYFNPIDNYYIRIDRWEINIYYDYLKETYYVGC